jgi:hypothetical protein
LLHLLLPEHDQDAWKQTDIAVFGALAAMDVNDHAGTVAVPDLEIQGFLEAQAEGVVASVLEIEQVLAELLLGDLIGRLLEVGSELPDDAEVGVKSLYDRGLDGEQVRLLFKFLDWVMVLPEESEEALSLDLAAFEREKMMPYVSSIERIAEEKGRAKGKTEGKIEGMAEGMVAAKVDDLFKFLTKRFQAALPADLEGNIRATTDLAKLASWIDTSLEASDLEDFRRICGI